MSDRGRRLQFAAAGVSLLGYLGLAHYANTLAGAHHWPAVLALLPELAAGGLLAWRFGAAPAALLFAALTALALRHFWPALERHTPWVYFLQDAGLDALLGLTFARTLRAGQPALCTRLADAAHGPLSELEVRYTRQVTLAWALFFFCMLALSCGLFAWASLRTWSVFANLCALPLIGTMFVVENLARQRILPRGNRPGILATLRVYLASPR